MFKKVLPSLVCFALLITLVACGGAKSSDSQTSSASSEGTPANEDERTQFVVGFDAEFPPFGYIAENGDYVGFDLDLAQEVADRNGWELVCQPINWDSKDMELDSGTIDCIWNGFTYTGREKLYTWTAPYIDSNIMVVVKADSDINKLEDMAGKRVAVQADSSGYYGIAGEDAPEENKAWVESFEILEQVSDYNMAFESLKAGTYDAVVVDILTGNTHMFKEDGLYRMLDEDVVVEQCAVGFKLGNESLRDIVEATLFDMLDDGTIEKCVEKYADFGMGMNAICLGNYKK